MNAYDIDIKVTLTLPERQEVSIVRYPIMAKNAVNAKSKALAKAGRQFKDTFTKTYKLEVTKVKLVATQPYLI
jgi:hypothetical protein